MDLMVKKKQGRKLCITAYPYAVQYGSLIVPDELSNPVAIKEYVEEHFNEIVFGEPVLSYRDTDFDIYEETF